MPGPNCQLKITMPWKGMDGFMTMGWTRFGATAFAVAVGPQRVSPEGNFGVRAQEEALDGFWMEQEDNFLAREAELEHVSILQEQIWLTMW